MKKYYAILVFLFIATSALHAQGVLLTQDFSKSNNVSDYWNANPTSGQFNLISSNYTTPLLSGDPAYYKAGIGTSQIINSKLQFDLRPTYKGADLYPTGGNVFFTADNSFNHLMMVEFKLNYSRSQQEGILPKPAILWFNNISLFYFGRDNSTEYFISIPDYQYHTQNSGVVQAPFYDGPAGNTFSGEHVIKLIVNNSESSGYYYKSLTVPAHSIAMYVDDVFQKISNYSFNRFRRDLNMNFETSSYHGMSQYDNLQQTPATHQIILDDFKIEDLTLSKLPVTLINFEGNSQEETTSLKWLTSEELNSDRFEIEHSTDAKEWRFIDYISAAGNSGKPTNYSYVHTNPNSGINYYRLKMIDIDKSFAYSRIVEVNKPSQLKIYPNPVTNLLTIDDGGKKEIRAVKIYDLRGQVVKTVILKEDKVDLSKVSPGLYTLKVIEKSGKEINSKIVVQH